MPTLTDDMRRVLDDARLGFVATVCPDGTPNLSPKGSVAAWDDEHVIFACARSPGTVANLRHNPAIEINVVHPFARKGYRFKGVATILEAGPRYDDALAFYRARGSRVSDVTAIVLVTVQQAQPIVALAYDQGTTEEQVRARWEAHFDGLRRGPSPERTDG